MAAATTPARRDSRARPADPRTPTPEARERPRGNTTTQPRPPARPTPRARARPGTADSGAERQDPLQTKADRSQGEPNPIDALRLIRRTNEMGVDARRSCVSPATPLAVARRPPLSVETPVICVFDIWLYYACAPPAGGALTGTKGDFSNELSAARRGRADGCAVRFRGLGECRVRGRQRLRYRDLRQGHGRRLPQPGVEALRRRAPAGPSGQARGQGEGEGASRRQRASTSSSSARAPTGSS